MLNSEHFRSPSQPTEDLDVSTCTRVAYLTQLFTRNLLVEARRLELLTSGLQSPRSAKLSYAPILSREVGCGGRI